MEDGPGKANLVPTKIGHRRALDCLVPGDSDHQTQGEGTVEDALPEFRLGAAILLIDVQQGRIVSHRREHHIVGQIGRASCRESVCPSVSISVVAVSLKKTNHHLNLTFSLVFYTHLLHHPLPSALQLLRHS